jgi:N-acetylglucosamine malate deacetylase 1
MAIQSHVRRLLAVMAHPDDAEILVGGTLFLLRDLGWELGILTMTAGDCGSATVSRREIAWIRYREAQKAASLLGASYSCAGLVDAEVFANAENFRRIVECMRQFDPDVVITHSPQDYMLDHEETSRLARGATFAIAVPNYDTRQNPPAKISRATPALYYADAVEGTEPLGQRLLPHFYVDVTKQISKKREMLACHASQRDWLRSHHGLDEYLDQMTVWAAGFGRESGFEYAEGFRQHLGHAYPREPILQEALAEHVRERKPSHGT